MVALGTVALETVALGMVALETVAALRNWITARLVARSVPSIARFIASVAASSGLAIIQAALSR